MPFVEDRAVTLTDPDAVIGANVPVATPSLFCALGQIEIAGLWHSARGVNARWQGRKPPVGRGWRPFDPGREGGF